MKGVRYLKEYVVESLLSSESFWKAPLKSRAKVHVLRNVSARCPRLTDTTVIILMFTIGHHDFEDEYRASGFLSLN